MEPVRKDQSIALGETNFDLSIEALTGTHSSPKRHRVEFHKSLTYNNWSNRDVTRFVERLKVPGREGPSLSMRLLSEFEKLGAVVLLTEQEYLTQCENLERLKQTYLSENAKDTERLKLAELRGFFGSRHMYLDYALKVVQTECGSQATIWRDDLESSTPLLKFVEADFTKIIRSRRDDGLTRNWKLPNGGISAPKLLQVINSVFQFRGWYSDITEDAGRGHMHPVKRIDKELLDYLKYYHFVKVEGPKEVLKAQEAASKVLLAKILKLKLYNDPHLTEAGILLNRNGSMLATEEADLSYKYSQYVDKNGSYVFLPEPDKTLEHVLDLFSKRNNYEYLKWTRFNWLDSEMARAERASSRVENFFKIRAKLDSIRDECEKVIAEKFGQSFVPKWRAERELYRKHLAIVVSAENLPYKLADRAILIADKEPYFVSETDLSPFRFLKERYPLDFRAGFSEFDKLHWPDAIVEICKREENRCRDELKRNYGGTTRPSSVNGNILGWDGVPTYRHPSVGGCDEGRIRDGYG